MTPSPAAPAPIVPPGPGELGDPLRPTERPNEPITTGLPFGPGAGPEVLPPANPAAQTFTSSVQALSAVAQNSPEAAYLLQRFTGSGL